MNNKPNNPQDKAPSISRATRKYERLLKSIPEQQDNVPQSVKSRIQLATKIIKKASDSLRQSDSTYTSWDDQHTIVQHMIVSAMLEFSTADLKEPKSITLQSAETILRQNMGTWSSPDFETALMAMEEYAALLKDRIAELEAEIQSFEPLITALEMDNLKLKARNKELTEALEKIKCHNVDNLGWREIGMNCVKLAEQVLKKDSEHG